MKKIIIVLVCVSFLTLGLFAETTADNGNIVEALKKIVKKNNKLKKALNESLEKAKYRIEGGKECENKKGELDLSTLPNYIDGKVPGKLGEYYEYVEKTVKWTPQIDPQNPDKREDYNAICLFYFLVTQHPDLKPCDTKDCETYPEFEQWLKAFANQWGQYLDTCGSINNDIIEDFKKAPNYNVEDYIPEPSGWKTFNQFFARNIRPGRRPVDSPSDDSVIVSPADSVCQGQWKIDKYLNIVQEEDKKKERYLNTVLKGEGKKIKPRFKGTCLEVPAVESSPIVKWVLKSPKAKNRRQVKTAENRLQVKANKYNIRQLLDNSKYADKFKNGLFMHSFLNTYDYHRFHAPVGGYVREARTVTDSNTMKTKVVLYVDIINGKFEAADPTGYQFQQARGILIIESPLVGLVAVLPIGMAQVSSVTVFAEKGMKIAKGDQFGYFTFGGSDMVILFQKGVNITAIKNSKYLVGRPIAESDKVIRLEGRKYLKK
ncbi:MAG: phosphatidylserine decarboxylase [Candidatus Aminicenantes bacterium]|nr:phosphatidylserine decarboxylase [Candidatus Aminicenantes bacterium]